MTPLDLLTKTKSDSGSPSEPQVLIQRYGRSNTERAQMLVGTEESNTSSPFSDAYDLVAKKVEEHPYIAAGTAGAALIGGALICHNFGTISRAVSRAGHAISSEARIALSSLTGKSAPAIEKPLLSTRSIDGANLGSRIDELLSTSSRTDSLGMTKSLARFGSQDLKAGSKSTIDDFLPALSPRYEHDPMAMMMRRAEDPFAAKSTALKILPRMASDAPPRSMGPKAYKVVRDDGSAIYDHRTKYPLPTQSEDGKFVPTNWVEPGDSMSLKTIQDIVDPTGRGGRSGIYVTSNPKMWKANQPGFSTYEVEIGDTLSIGKWEKAPHPGFRLDAVAQRVRLLRKVPDEEIAAMQVTQEDILALAFNTMLRY